MANTSDIKKGLCINYNHDIFKIVEFQHVKPGKGPAFVRTKLKSLTNGRILDNTFSAGHKIDVVRVETRKYQFLYNDDSGYHFMNTDDYNQIALGKDLVDDARFLKEGIEVTILFDAAEERPLTVELPAHIVLEVTESAPGVKGNTATNATKDATVETGTIIQVPLFINEGDRVKISTEDGAYMERVKD